MIIDIIIDIILSAFVIWSVFNEDKYILLEEKIKGGLKK